MHKFSMRKRELFPLFFLLALLSFHAVTNYIWLRQDTMVPIFDAQFHNMRLNMYEVLKNPSMSMLSSVSSIFEIGSFYPPFLPFSAALVNIFFGTSLDVSVMTNIFYFALLLFSVYKIGVKIDTPATGLLAALLVSLYPGIVGLSRILLPGFALCALISFSIYSLLYSDTFRNRKYSLLFGISVGAGMLTKWTFVFFLFGPLCYIFMELMKDNSIPINLRRKGIARTVRSFLAISKLQFLNITYSFLITFFIAGAYYLKFSEIKDLFNLGLFQAETTGMLWYGIKNIMYYPLGLINIHISFIFFVVFIFALFCLGVSKAKIKKRGLLALWIAAPYIIYTFIIPTKDIRYIHGFLPAIALFSAAGLMRIADRKVKTAIVTLVISFGLLQFFDTSFGYDIIPDASPIYIKTLSAPIEVRYRVSYVCGKILFGPPVRDRHIRNVMDAVFDSIEKHRDKTLPESSILLEQPFTEAVFLGPDQCRYIIRDKNLPLNVHQVNIRLSEFMMLYIKELECIHFWVTASNIKDSSYPLLLQQKLKESDLSVGISDRKISEEEWELLGRAVSHFRLLRYIPVDDTLGIYVYANVKELRRIE